MKQRNVLSVEFFSSRSLHEANGCWNWLGDRCQRYPRVVIFGKRRRISHWICELKGTPVTAGLLAMHLCDNPRCVNPGHIKLGTFSENAMDSVNKSRFGGLKKRSKETRKRMADARTGYVMLQTTKDKLRTIWKEKREKAAA